MPAIAIVGATGTIGRSLTKLLHGQGKSLVLAGRNPEKLSALSEEMGFPGVVFDPKLC